MSYIHTQVKWDVTLKTGTFLLTWWLKPVIINSCSFISRMKFDEINSVQDLVNKNEATDLKTDILKTVYREDPSLGMEIAKDIIESLANFHVDAVADYREKGMASESAIWAHDLALLKTASQLLDEVQV